MNDIPAIRRGLLLCAGVAAVVVVLVNTLVAGVASMGVIEYGFIWYCACLAAAAAAVMLSEQARAKVRVLLVFPAVSAYVYAFGVALPDPAAPLHVSPAGLGFAMMFFCCPASAIYMAVIAWRSRRTHAPAAQVQAFPT